VKFRGLRIVAQIDHHDLVENLRMDGRVMNRHEGFHPAVHIAGHPVRAGDEHLVAAGGQGMAIGKHANPRMFQKPPDDGFDPDILGQSGHAGPQAANAPHHDRRRHPGARGLVKLVDQPVIDQRVHLQPHARRPSGLRMGDLVIDQRPDGLPRRQRRERQLFHRLRAGIAGHVIEQPGRIAR